MASLGKYDNSPVRMVLLTAFLLSSILLLSQRGSPNFSQPAKRGAEDAIAPIAQILSLPIRGVENIAFDLKDRSRAHQENIALRKELIALRDKAARLDLLQLKVNRYEHILSTNIDANIPTKKIVARAVSESNGPFVRSLLLNIGTEQGVKIGNPVMSADGLIGHVINSGRQSSRVLQLGDLNSRIPVLNLRSESKAILSGDNSLRPVLTFIQDASDWRAGDNVITSGDDGMLPIGLPIGRIVKDNGAVLRVKLHAEKVPIDWVWVSPYARITAPSDVQIDQDGSLGPDALAQAQVSASGVTVNNSNLESTDNISSEENLSDKSLPDNKPSDNKPSDNKPSDNKPFAEGGLQ